MNPLLPLSLAATAAFLWAISMHLRLRRLRGDAAPDVPTSPADAAPLVESGPFAWHMGQTEEAEGATLPVEAALRESETRFRTVVESLGEGLIINDWDGNILYVNRRMTELSGYARDELVGHPITSTLIPEELREIILAKLEDRRAGKAEEYEFELQRKDGTRLWTEVHGRPHRNAKGQVVGTLSTVTDITERRRAQEALRASEERYRALFEDDVAGNFITSAEGTILACNQAFALIFGYASVAEAVGAPALPHAVNAAAREAFLDEVRDKGRIEYHEVEMRRKDGSPVHVVENVNGIFDDAGELTGLQGHLIDVSDRKVLQEQLRQSQKMEAVGRLAGGIAHDFNNLLTAITGYTELLLMNSAAHPAIRDDLEKIQQATDRAGTLTNQLLAFSRRQVLQPKVIDLNGVVEGVSSMLERLIGENITLETELERGLWKVRADPNQLEQVLMNLVVNARDAMPGGGNLSLTTRNFELDGAVAARRLELAPGSYTVLEVSDDGEGIPAELHDQIFEPFFTTKEAGKGTGLGLSMAYGLMKQSGGHISVDSAPGKGTVFRIYLPRVSDDAAAVEAGGSSGAGVAQPGAASGRRVADPHRAGADHPGASSPVTMPATPVSPGSATAPDTVGGPHGDETLLLVEDDAMVRSLARRVLSRKGYTVLECEHPHAALERSREWPEAIHLLLADIRMPEMDGITLAERIGPSRPEMKVLFISGLDEAAAKGKDRRHPLLSKPFTPVELLEGVREVLDSRQEAAAARTLPV